MAWNVDNEVLNKYIGSDDACIYLRYVENAEWVHDKTGNIYVSLNIIFDATNETEGRLMMVYHRKDLEEDCTYYCRDLKEFLAKFTLKTTSNPELLKLKSYGTSILCK